MKNLIGIFSICSFLLVGCSSYKKILTDEVWLKNGNSQTGTITKCDSSSIELKKVDQSITHIEWSEIESIKGKKFKSAWFGNNIGYHHAPYFSVFRNEPFVAQNMGSQFKVGMAVREKKLYYLSYLVLPAKPYSVRKLGVGNQRYLGGTTYLSRNSYFVGGEFNMMTVDRNNGPQFTIEPFTGYERKVSEQIRLHFKFGLQLNLANKNNQSGFQTTIGIHFMKRNFKKYYETLNQERRLPRK